MSAKALPAIDERTRTIIHGTLRVDAETGAIVITIPMKLEGTNRGMWGGHWSRKHKASEEWETRLRTLMAHHAGCDTISGFHPNYLGALGLPPVTTKRVVQVHRICPSRRNFTRDDDHTPMAQKPLLDAIKRLGFIRQDSRNWIELKPLAQEVSPDGKWWTAIEITVPAEAHLPSTAASPAARTARPAR